MKKLFYIFLAAALLCSCSRNRDEILKVYNWSNYIGEGVIADFEQWYEQQTGKRISVIYQTFDINETMLSKIEKGHEDFDVVCPSDYMIERMLNGGFLKTLDFSAIPDSINYIDKTRSPYIRDIFRVINPELDANDYSVAYMWGTTGLLYNPKYVAENEIAGWDVLCNPKFAGKILIKDAPRDVFAPVLIHLRQEQIKKGETTIQALMSDSSDKSVAEVENFLKSMRDGVAGWEADFGKEMMTQERAWISFNWSGDAVWAIEEAAKIGVKLKYIVPEEGSTVWFDGWVIPKYAVNVKAATLFIDFMCRPDIAIRNMDETGYVSANGDISVVESQLDESLDPIDLSYFFGPEAAAMKIDPVLYPARKTVENCALEHDWGSDTAKLIAMWARVKGDNAGSSTIIVILVVVLTLAGAAVYSKLHSRKKSHRKPVRRNLRK